MLSVVLCALFASLGHVQHGNTATHCASDGDFATSAFCGMCCEGVHGLCAPTSSPCLLCTRVCCVCRVEGWKGVGLGLGGAGYVERGLFCVLLIVYVWRGWLSWQRVRNARRQRKAFVGVDIVQFRKAMAAIATGG
jgi:hypothetical protein